MISLVVQMAIRHAEQLEFENVDHVLRVLQRPYQDQYDTAFPLHDDHDTPFDASPDWAADICVSCSS